MEEEKVAVEVQAAPAMEAASANPAIVPSVVAEATLGQRIGAFLIDAVVVFAISLVLGKISGTLGFAAGSAYWVLRDSLPFLDGQSIGKKALKIRAVTEDGASLSGNWNPGVIRNIALVIPFFALVELIVLIIAQGKPGGLLRLGDQWAKTKVVTVA